MTITPNTPTRARPKPGATARAESVGARLADAGLVAAFLGLAFLLGAFPTKDFDIWFHLKTGDLIRRGQPIPSHDLYTFTVPESPWIDLHWGFQVATSWAYQRGGMKGLNLAKCAVTCAALLLLITARRRDWPIWTMVLAWLPALFLLGGRMYVRPETLTLLFLSIFLAVLSRWDRDPGLAYVLPVAQALWVNVQGLFVLGPIVLAMALADASLAPGAFGEARKRWWRVVGPACGLTVLACLLNPYGIEGVLFPIQLSQTMGSPIFNQTIAELTPIPVFIRRHGWGPLPLRIHLATLALGVLSFLIPLAWRLTLPKASPAAVAKARPGEKAEGADGEVPRARARRSKKGAGREETWRLRPFRLLLFLAFGWLGLQATRNSHQFAAVAGAVTAWNLGEWAAAIRRRDPRPKGAPGWGAAPRALAFAAVAGAFAFVASGAFYAMAGEGRIIGLGEHPLWYPHDAVRFAGREGMPPRMLGYHIGYPALFEYDHAPDRKVFADPRLEVIGPNLYERYVALESTIAERRPGWERRLDELGRPSIVIENAGHPGMAASLMAGPRWRCVWFDPIASVFVHEEGAAFPAVDFLERHFRPGSADDPEGLPALSASASAIWAIAQTLQASGRVDLARSLVPLGMDQARRVREADPGSSVGWKLLGQLELARQPATAPGSPPSRRFRKPLDPVLDLGPVRATYALRQALGRDPDAPLVLYSLAESYRARGLAEAALPLLDRLAALSPTNPAQRAIQSRIEGPRDALRRMLGPSPTLAGRPNAQELDRAVSDLLERGRAASAAGLLGLEKPAEARTWAETDLLATLGLHLGDPAAARETWLSAVSPPRPALRTARVALTYLAEGDFDAARRAYREAIAAEPSLFEARYGLAALEHDAGRAAESATAAREALAVAPGAVAEAAARALASAARPYASVGAEAAR